MNPDRKHLKLTPKYLGIRQSRVSRCYDWPRSRVVQEPEWHISSREASHGCFGRGVCLLKDALAAISGTSCSFDATALPRTICSHYRLPCISNSVYVQKYSNHMSSISVQNKGSTGALRAIMAMVEYQQATLNLAQAAAEVSWSALLHAMSQFCSLLQAAAA